MFGKKKDLAKEQEKRSLAETKKSREAYYVDAKKETSDLLKELHSDMAKGLAPEAVEESRDKYGANVLKKVKDDSAFVRLVHAFLSPFSLILVSIAIIDTIVSLIPSSSYDPSWYFTPLIIVLIVLISGLTSFVQESKGRKSAMALRSMAENTSTVLREGNYKEVPNSELVLGDVVRLGAGDMVPADLRILQAKDLYLTQSALTGESLPVEKDAKPFSGDIKKTNVFDVSNLAFQGSNVVSGQGVGLIIRVGEKTVFGALAKKVTTKRGPSALQKGVGKIARLLFSLILVMVPLIFVIDGVGLRFGPEGISVSGFDDYHQWIDALLFAISVAVGLTPALLPMQMAANLAKGAVKMSEKKVIVKDINTIQSFGAMDVLCTDKTGTLTEEESALSDYFSFDKEESYRVLRLAYMNAYFQTGIRSAIDRAILAYGTADQNFQDDNTEGYSKLDELPFDFERKILSILLKRQDGSAFLVSKGALESILSRVSSVREKDSIRPITEQDKTNIRKENDEEAAQGRRTILLATKEFKGTSLVPEDEQGLVFEGIVSFEDLPKPSAGKALDALFSYGVSTKVLTGDNMPGSVSVMKAAGCEKVVAYSGSELEEMDEQKRLEAIERGNLFYRLSPEDKLLIVSALQKNKHVVGFMGDGINDAAALKQSDVGISFKGATDIARESADIILLENDLMALEEGIIEGRKAYVNMMKYLKGQLSSNFGNMISQMIGALWIPFLPMQAVQILLLDIVTDISCAMIPFDNVDPEAIKKPLDFSVPQIRSFMFLFGPLSSMVDMLTFATLFYFVCPLLVSSGPLGALGNGMSLTPFDPSWSHVSSEYLLFMGAFQTGFFIESLLTQNVVYGFLRTDKPPFIKSFPSTTLTLGIITSCLVGLFLIYVPGLNGFFSFVTLHPIFLAILFGELVLYCLLTEGAKRLYKKRYGRLL